jgi:hypothetical protein
MSIRILIVLAAAATTYIEVSAAASPDEASAPRKLLITPAVEPRPALKYQLLPKFVDRRPGNAAPRYAKAMLGRPANSEFDAKIVAWLELSPAEFARPGILKEIKAAHLGAVVEELRSAANTEHCDWDLPLREQMVFSIRLPEVQEMRRMSNYVALHARVLLAEGQFDESAATLAAGYAMARHIAQGPTLINALVGYAIAARMDKVVLDWSQTPAAPSLFWAATFLPKPIVDLRPGLEGEMYSLLLSFPSLRLSAKSDAQWKADADQLLRDFYGVHGQLAADGEPAGWIKVFSNAAVSASVVMRRDAMREFLEVCGRDRESVVAMDDSRLFLEYSVLKFEDLRDDMFRWTSLPYPEARAGIEAAEQRLKASKDAKSSDHEIVPFAALLLPAVAQVSKMSARHERRADVLRIVEGLRVYTGRHDGKLPKTLNELELPISEVDAVTGLPLDYKLRDNTAIITLPGERNDAGNSTLIYEIDVARPKSP